MTEEKKTISDGGSGESGTDPSPLKKKVPTWVWIVGGVLVLGLILQSCGGNGTAPDETAVTETTETEGVEEEAVESEPDSSSQDLPSDETCYLAAGYLEPAENTSSALVEMSGSISDAVAVGTEESLRSVSLELRAIHGPRFAALSEEWRTLPSCGDTEVDSLVGEMADTLTSLGSLLSQYEYGNIEDLEQAIVYMQDIATIAGLITERI